jgi:hypothetical protein
LSVSQRGAAPIEYPYMYIAPSNTGVPSGYDLDNDGSVGGPNDALGCGFFPGQFGLVVYSKYPIEKDAVRTFQTFLWKDMPAARLPDDPATSAPADWYSPAELAVFRLSSKSHWDVPIKIEAETVHFLVSIRHRRSPTVRKTAMERGISMRSASGPTTSRLRSRATSTTTMCVAGSSPAPCSSSRETRTRIRSTATASPGRSSNSSGTHSSTRSSRLEPWSGRAEQAPFLSASSRSRARTIASSGSTRRFRSTTSRPAGFRRRFRPPPEARGGAP